MEFEFLVYAPPHNTPSKKNLIQFLNTFGNTEGLGNNDMKYLGKLERVFFLINARLLPVFFYDEESHQGKALLTHPWVVNPGYTTPFIITTYRVNQGKLLVGIESKMSRYTTQPKPPNTKLHPNR